MTPLELALLLSFVLVVLVVVVGGLAVIAMARAASDVAGALSTRTSGQPATLHDVEAYLDTLAHEPHVDTAVVTEIVPESRRPGPWPLALARAQRDGLRVDAVVPTPQRQVASEWFALPDSLDGDSRFERLLDAHGVPAQDLSELLGAEVPVEKVDGRWQFVVEPDGGTNVRAMVERGLSVVRASGRAR